MVNRCFRHQHPEAYGRYPARTPKYSELVAVSEVPDELVWRDRMSSGWAIPEEPMGTGSAWVGEDVRQVLERMRETA
jgi:hypothetical protein